MSTKIQTNLDKKNLSYGNNPEINVYSMIKDEKLVDNLRKLVNDYLDLVS
jgi:hypothetical protein